MPNWCSNTLVLEHTDPAMLERAKDAFARGEFLTEFIPVPRDLIDTDSPNRDADQSNSLREKHGYSDWYSFCVNEWGTKWDVGSDDGITDATENSIRMYFDSAWAPPVAAYERLEQLGFKVTAMYHEPGVCFAGKYQDGEDDCYDLSDMTTDEVRSEIPEDLDQEFGITEMMAEWDEENSEDEE